MVFQLDIEMLTSERERMGVEKVLFLLPKMTLYIVLARVVKTL